MSIDHLEMPEDRVLDVSSDASESDTSAPGESALDELALRLAEEHVDCRRGGGEPSLMNRLQDQESLLREAYSHFVQMPDAERALSFAAEWLLDNFYVVRQALRQVREDVPAGGYYRKLPKLTSSSLEGYPRVYALAREIVRCCESQLDLDQIERFIGVYQTVTPLTMGELWALPTMLRLAVLECLTQTLTGVAGVHSWGGESDDPLLIPRSPDLADDVVVSNCILSLRLLATPVWNAFFERVSLVERTLGRDPARIYAEMDSETRDHYRKVVEELAEAVGRAEDEIAQEAVELAQERLLALKSLEGAFGKVASSRVYDTDERDFESVSHDGPSQATDRWEGLGLHRSAHVGFYLLDEGRAQLEARLGYQPSARERLRRWAFRHSMLVYLGGIGAITAILVCGAVSYAAARGGTPAQLIGAGSLFLLPVSAVAVSLINRLVTHVVPLRRLPKLDLSPGIPKVCRTAVVIPVILGNVKDIESVLKQIELHYLGNANDNLSFALLTDFTDAPQKHMPGDDVMLERVKTGIQELNQKYGRRGVEPFYLFHRDRKWNEAEDCWMGWERKRGKLNQFNRLLLGKEPSYRVRIGDVNRLQEVKYVITLDADTVLPRDGARRLIATLAHPLNQAEISSDGHSVVAGYTILQPRVEIQPTSVNRTLFSQVYGGDAGLDLYTRAVSDVYQDLFGEGNYVGKGAYDVAAFEHSLAERLPENALLSHDLFEGIHGRVGLVTDVVLYEDYPSSYLAYTRRLHRWVRGDWQLLPWLLPRVPGSGDRRLPNEFSMLNLWKIVDNLRRSLVKPALLGLLLAGWMWLPGPAWVWTLGGALTLAVPASTGLVRALIQSVRRRSWAGIIHSLRMDILHWLFMLTFLPYETLILIDAIAATLVRLIFTHKHLLQWTTSAHTVRVFGRKTKLALLWQKMGVVSVLSLGLTFLVGVVKQQALLAAVALLFLWVESPQVAYWISLPLSRDRVRLSATLRRQLRRLARRTWLYFEQFIRPDDHWLPPDHFQEDPRGLVARRTSPTNIGLFLLSTMAAYDLGYIGPLDLVLRLRLTFESMDRLAWYRGHFLNWYDTRDLRPLTPRYVSTVDSGNLAASLVVLKQGLLSLSRNAIPRWHRWQGLLDTLDVLNEVVQEVRGEDYVEPAVILQDYLSSIRQRVLEVKAQPQEWAALLDELSSEGRSRLEELLIALIECDVTLDVVTLGDLRIWAERVSSQLGGMQSDYDMLLPWLLPLSQPPKLFSWPGLRPEVADAWSALKGALKVTPVFDEVPDVCRSGRTWVRRLEKHLLGQAGSELTERVGPERADWVQEARDWCRQMVTKLDTARMTVETLLISCRDLSEQAESYFQAMDFSFLFDSQREIFHIGYNVEVDALDDNYYDLLASEARIASLLAIAKGDVSQSHWLHLARPIVRVDGTRALLSWGGSMFEYLMPALLIRSYEDTLLQQSCRAAVDRQITYARRRGVPWGISESGYYWFDANQNYQYRGFGVPGLGFKRGLSEDLVVAPYASLLALSIYPRTVMKNIARLTEVGMLGRYGFYESIDYTDDHLPSGQESAIVRSYMVHHHGMSLLSLLNYLHDDVMIRRFHADPRVQSVQLLLQEQVPYQAPVEERPHPEEVRPIQHVQPSVNVVPWPVPVDTPVPLVHTFSNGRYSVLVTNSGGGYSRWKGIDLTRWRADATLDNWGTWIYVLEGAGQSDGALGSAGRQPTGVRLEQQEVVFHPHKVEFRQHDRHVALRMEVTVSPADDVEVRRIALTNHDDRPRRLTLVSYAEVVLAPQSVDRRHPAFNKLFIESEYVADFDCLLFHRRLRSHEEAPIFLAHTMVGETGRAFECVYETDRARFVGRGRTVRSPGALVSPPSPPTAEGSDAEGVWLSGTTGATLDPIMALGATVELPPHSTLRLAYVTLAADSRQQALTLVRRYRVWSTVGGCFDRARSRGELELHRLNMPTSEVEGLQRVLSALLYPSSSLRADPSMLMANKKGQPALWPYAISGDYPILLVRVYDEEDVDLVREALRSHAYYRRRQIQIDLVILNEQDTSYDQELQGHLYRLIDQMDGDAWLNRRGGIFVLQADQMGREDRTLLMTAARVVLDGGGGSLVEQAGRLCQRPTRLPAFVSVAVHPDGEEGLAPLERPAGLRFDNGWGGFDADGREYVVFVEAGRWTPAPWINVLANEDFGCIVSEAGLGYSWAINSGENKLTPWRNDPVSDEPAEAIYLRDEEVGHVWSPTPLPAGGAAPYLVRHGAGYSTFEHHSHGLKQRVRVFVVPDAPLKIVHLQLENAWRRNRRVTVTYYAEWVLGPERDTHQQYVVSEFDAINNALLAHNRYNVEFGERVAFLSANKEPHSLTTDRTEFLGRGGCRRRPAGLDRVGLSNAVGPDFDPCAAFQVNVWLAPGETEEVFFLLGQGVDRKEALRLVKRYQDPSQIEYAWQVVGQRWDDLLGTISVQTPDPGMDLLLNRWLLYQTLTCRVWGRSALYQSSGAFGYRDQLQDVMALVYAAPQIARDHILRAARYQFEQGDVLHWWHPPSGRGVRTRCSDDLLWLPFVTAHYVTATGDWDVLIEKMPFLTGDPLQEDEHERYGHYEHGSELCTLYEHCRRALEMGTTAGVHGLPLIGSHDWNDGFNRVGVEGRGESVWLGWFLYATLIRFAPLCEHIGDDDQAEAYRQRAEALRRALEESAWDGDWYRRAYYDDGTPLGSAENDECQIDSLAQSWAVLSRAADPRRARRAMEAVGDRLVRSDDQLVLLFAPPFDKTSHDPGYIKGYPPGIRENGGQYTHAALWVAWAFAELGLGDRAEALFCLLNPIYHGDTPEKETCYRVEPYAVAADVYSVPPYVGRGGWTWYTGSAGWMYRLGVEAILGLRRMGKVFQVDPCIPKDWRAYQITYRDNSTVYRIRVENPRRVNRGVKQVSLDGELMPEGKIPLTGDGRRHEVRVVMG